MGGGGGLVDGGGGGGAEASDFLKYESKFKIFFFGRGRGGGGSVRGREARVSNVFT